MATKRKKVPRVRKIQRRRAKRKKLAEKGVKPDTLFFEGFYVGPIKSR
ncbi:MAG: hypothetical protein JW844_05440 [Candidatus Omnitrophica bacterium]|nr:hypothetical protein [Candidatus Omnitrophota bacterium]